MDNQDNSLGTRYVGLNTRGVGAGVGRARSVYNDLVRSFTTSPNRFTADETLKIYPQRKMAEFAGSPSLTEAERGAWRVSEAYIRDKVPQLTDYCIGFQLLKKTDDDSRVCGIFAYKVGDELLYIPVFSINGEVQGHELMYIVSRDQFVPSDEKWVNYLLSRKPLEPGKVELRERSEIPAAAGYSPSRMTSGLKLSSYNEIPQLDPVITLDALRTIFKEAAVGEDALETIQWKSVVAQSNLNDLFSSSRKATKLAEVWSKTFPVYGRLLNYVLDGKGIDGHLQLWEKKASLAKQLGVRPVSKPTLNEYIRSQIPKQAAAVPKEEKVAVYPIDCIPKHQFRFMPTSLIDRIHRDGYYVADNRDQTKLASVVDGQDHGISNPVGPGLYNVFLSDGTFKPFFIFYGDEFSGWGGYCCEPSYHDSSAGERYVLLCPKTKRVRWEDRKDIWVSEKSPEKGWFDKIPASNAELHSGMDYWDRHKDILSLLITPNGTVRSGKFEEVDENTYYDYDNQVSFSLLSSGTNNFRELRNGRGGLVQVIAPKGTILRRYDNKGDKNMIPLGSSELWLLRLMEGTSAVSLRKRVGTYHDEYFVDESPAESKEGALEHLMREHHLSQGTAEMLLKEADVAAPYPIRRLREKIAFSGEVPRDKLSVNFPQKEKGQHDITGLEVDQDLFTEEPVEALQTDHVPTEDEMWPGLMIADTDKMNTAPPAPNQRDLQLATQAAQSGQKDFVSSQMLMSLLREIDDDGIINKYITIFEKACDTLGRLYMQILWRTDAFEDRFGKTQLKEFREMLVSLFQQMGDFICYLRQRDIRPSPVLSLDAMNIDDGEVQ
jgi:hypothetical protein